MRLLGCFLLLWSLTVWADEQVSVCFNYGCAAQAEVVYSNRQLRKIGRVLRVADDAAEERDAIAVAIGHLLGWAGKQTPISADRGGNYVDDEVSGRMDCIDHSTTTTRLLQMMETRGLLRFHRVLEPVMRQRYLVLIHYSALIEEVLPANAGGEPGRYVVDSWFVDNGQPAVVMPLASWLAGEGPNVGD